MFPPSHQLKLSISMLAKALATLYMVLVTAVIACAVYVWNIRCEGFGCAGRGIAWFAWVLFYLVVWIPGFGARHLFRNDPRARQILGWIMVIQLVVGLALAAAWVAYNLVSSSA